MPSDVVGIPETAITQLYRSQMPFNISGNISFTDVSSGNLSNEGLVLYVDVNGTVAEINVTFSYSSDIVIGQIDRTIGQSTRLLLDEKQQIQTKLAKLGEDSSEDD